MVERVGLFFFIVINSRHEASTALMIFESVAIFLKAKLDIYLDVWEEIYHCTIFPPTLLLKRRGRGFRKWLDHEDGGLLNGIGVFIRESPGRALIFSSL